MKSCNDYQNEVLRQQAASFLVSKHIDEISDDVIRCLKKTIVSKHYYAQRIFSAENFDINSDECIQEVTKADIFGPQEKNISDNFAAIDLPADFQKGPMKAFLNTLLDSLENFLPAFYKLNPNKFPPGRFLASPCDYLVRCVFPALFGYCWALEPAQAYAENLVRWFGEIYCSKPEFTTKFRNHWMFNAMRGFFTCLDFNHFIEAAIEPVYTSYIQQPSNQQQNATYLISKAIAIVNNIRQFYSTLPSVLNTLFTLLYEKIKSLCQENNKDPESEYSQMVIYLLYDGLIQQFLKSPILYVAKRLVPLTDAINFYDIYTVFLVKFGKTENLNKELVESIQNDPLFAQFDPMSIIPDTKSQIATGTLPSLQEFCNIVQCAHQPLLMTTHSLALLFRFVASLQHMAALPKSIDRSIDSVFQQALADKLEDYNDYFFWFPCYSLTYMNINATKFEKSMLLSPIYRLLSNRDLHLFATCTDFYDAFSKAEETTVSAFHPQLSTEIHWLLHSQGESLREIQPKLEEEIKKKWEEIKDRRKRVDRLCTMNYTLDAINQSLPSENPMMSIGIQLFERFQKIHDIMPRAFIEVAVQKINEMCGPSFNAFGKYIAIGLVMSLSPNVKSEIIPDNTKPKEYAEGAVGEMQKLVRPSIITSSLIPDAIRLAQDCTTVLKYSSEQHIENALVRCFAPPFIPNPSMISQNLNNCLSFFPDDLQDYVFNKEERSSLRAFFISIT